MSESEFMRPIRVDTIGEAPRSIEIEADEGERAAIARRFGLVSIARLKGTAAVRRDASAIIAEGRIEAEVEQSCVATGEPVAARVEEPFVLRFVPEASAGDAEIELDAGDLDTIGYDGASIDLGEAVAETMALALDPFPRSPDADAVLREAGVLSEGDAGPFAALKALRDKLVGD